MFYHEKCVIFSSQWFFFYNKLSDIYRLCSACKPHNKYLILFLNLVLSRTNGGSLLWR